MALTTTSRAFIDFERIRSVSLNYAQPILERWLPQGRRVGSEYVSVNPRRNDTRPGSFKINLRTGLWSDFATGDRGGDLIALGAFLFDLSQHEAALRLQEMMGIRNG